MLLTVINHNQRERDDDGYQQAGVEGWSLGEDRFDGIPLLDGLNASCLCFLSTCNIYILLNGKHIAATLIDQFQGTAASAGYTGEGVLGNQYRKSCLLLQQTVDIP